MKKIYNLANDYFSLIFIFQAQGSSHDEVFIWILTRYMDTTLRTLAIEGCYLHSCFRGKSRDFVTGNLEHSRYRGSYML